MKLTVYRADEAKNTSRPKTATIQVSGSLTFSLGAVVLMGLDETKGLLIGTNANNDKDKNLYVVVDKTENPDAFSFKIAGATCYLKTTKLFRQLGYEFKDGSIKFNVTIHRKKEPIIYKLKLIQ